MTSCVIGETGSGLDRALTNTLEDHLAGELGLAAKLLEEHRKIVIHLKGNADRN
jgi:TorA maturation chaperone TorD